MVKNHEEDTNLQQSSDKSLLEKTREGLKMSQITENKIESDSAYDKSVSKDHGQLDVEPGGDENVDRNDQKLDVLVLPKNPQNDSQSGHNNELKYFKSQTSYYIRDEETANESCNSSRNNSPDSGASADHGSSQLSTDELHSSDNESSQSDKSIEKDNNLGSEMKLKVNQIPPESPKSLSKVLRSDLDRELTRNDTSDSGCGDSIGFIPTSESIELSEKPMEKSEVMGLHSIYMKQLSKGADNLAFIMEEEPDEGNDGGGCVFLDGEKCVSSNNLKNVHGDIITLPKGPGNGKAVSNEWVLDNMQRKCIREMRKRINSTATKNDGISVGDFTELFSKKELLVKLFELFDFKKENELEQDEWIEFLKSRLNREERQVDFVEVVESVAYAVCGEENVKFDQFCAIFRTKNVLNKFYRLIDRDLNGVVTAEQIMNFISALSTARSSNRLTKENIEWLEQLFRQYVGPGNEIRKEDFKKIIQTKNQFFTDRVFDIFDKDASGSISLHEFLEAMHQFAGQEPDDKLRFLFKIYDVDGDGSIQCDELGKVMRACMEENGMKFSDDQIHELTMALFEDADVEKRGALTFDALKAQLQKHEGLLENLSISIERWLVPPKPKESDVSSLKNTLKAMHPHQLSFKYCKNNYVYLIWLFIFMFTNICLFVSRCILFREDHPSATTYLVLARGAGQCLNFNCTFIVVAMLRQCLTFLRARGASAFLPIDQHIYFHKMTGWFIFLFSVFHTVMHLINIDAGLLPSTGDLGDCLESENSTCPVNSGNWSYLQFLFDPTPSSQYKILSFGLIPGFAFNSGVVLMIILTTMVICSLPFVRRGGCFEVFYWTHLLYFLFWALLIIHAPNFWKWFIVPGIIFLIEQALRYYHWRMGRGRTSVSSGILLPSKVTHLVIRRPPNFEFHPGDYVFVRIPQIAKYEWHPFTISSAPEQPDAIWLHIRAVGQWTTRLYEYFDGEQQKMNVICSGERDRLSTCVSNSTVKSIDMQDKVFYDGRTNLEPTITTSGVDRRSRLPTVGVPDSQETINPTSSSSMASDVNESVHDLSSSIETLSEQDSMIRKKKAPIRTKPKPLLTSTKSLPNVHERLVKREVKMNLRNAPNTFQRSLSVTEAPEEGDSAQATRSGVSSPIGLNSRNNRVPRSLRYMRNKPRIISLKTPSYEGLALTSRKQQPFGDKLAEEGLANGDVSEVFETEGNELHPIMGTTRTGQGSLAVGRPLEIYLDGPYGAPSSHIFRAEHAVLIATGIGVTPFASILQSIMHRYWATRVCCPQCKFTWCGELPQSVLNLKKVDFFWINRDQRSFEWFVHLLSQLEIEQAELGGAMERFLDMHMFITSALQKTDMKAVGLQLALDLLHEREKRDLITGLKTKTHAGRPNWSKMFQQLQDQKKGKITVFYCGPPALARTLKYKCDEFGFSFRKELF